MRVRGLLKLAVWGAFLGYLAHVGVSAGGNYLEVRRVVEQVTQEWVGRGRVLAIGRPGIVASDHAATVREAILQRALREGLSLDERNVVVSQTAGVLRVRLTWSYPVITLNGGIGLTILMGLDRSYDLTP